MAFSFYGTATSGQWEVLLAFSKIQRLDLRLRKKWLQAELSRNGVFVTEYENGVPQRFFARPGSYAGKLLEAYKILGGVPERDMLLRTRDLPVFKTKSVNMGVSSGGMPVGGFSDVYSNGRRERGPQKFDRDLGLRVESFKSWQLEAVKFKRERLEYKIRKALDRADELQKEIELIDRLLNDSDRKSFISQVAAVESAMAEPGAANIVDDLEDVHGLHIGRPADLTYDDALEVAEEEDQRVVEG